MFICRHTVLSFSRQNVISRQKLRVTKTNCEIVKPQSDLCPLSLTIFPFLQWLNITQSSFFFKFNDMTPCFKIQWYDPLFKNSMIWPFALSLSFYSPFMSSLCKVPDSREKCVHNVLLCELQPLTRKAVHS